MCIYTLFAKKKRRLTLMLVAMSMVAVMAAVPSRALAVSRDEAVGWAMLQEGSYLDYDGAYGAQCVDLIKYYYDIFGVASYARGNGCDYVSNALPPGWQRIQNNRGLRPRSWRYSCVGHGPEQEVSVKSSASTIDAI
jgi:hypothetical protein